MNPVVYFTWQIRRRERYEVHRPCVNGRCTEIVDSRNGRVLGGMGPAGCGCS